MEYINYNGVDGVFITNDEFKAIKYKIAMNNKLIMSLLYEISPDGAFNELLNMELL